MANSRPQKHDRTLLAAAPPPSAAQIAESARIEQMVGAWKAQAMLFPTETARWLASHSVSKIELTGARIVRTKTAIEPLQQVPDPAEQPSQPGDDRTETVANLLLAALQGMLPPGVAIERVHQRAIEHKWRAQLSKQPFPVVLDATGTVDGEKPHRMLLGLALPPPSEDGTRMQEEIVGSVPWYMHACVELATKAGASRAKALEEISFFTVPVYVWHGGGILDPEEDGGPGDQVDPIKLLFGRTFVREETEEERERRREWIRGVNGRRLARDADRRHSAEQRHRLFGDRMITEDQLRGLHIPLPEDAQYSHGLHTQWRSVRLWEQDAHRLVSELPLELLGLTMLAAPGQSTREEILQKALWRLRHLKQRAEFERCLIPLAAMAHVWIPDDRSMPIIERAAKPFWGPT